MILSGDAIEEQVHSGSIIITPFNSKFITTNSYDFHLQNKLLVYTQSELDVRRDNATRTVSIPADGLILEPGELYLGATVEKMGSDEYVPIIRGISSVARLGLFVHATADLIDIGSINNWTLQLIPTIPVRVYSGMRIGQVTFWSVMGSRNRLYSGKYNGATGAVASKSYLDYKAQLI